MADELGLGEYAPAFRDNDIDADGASESDVPKI